MEILVSIAAIVVILALLPYALPVLGNILLFIFIPLVKLFTWIVYIILFIIGIPFFLILAPFQFMGYLTFELTPDILNQLLKKLYTVNIIKNIFNRLSNIFTRYRLIFDFIFALGLALPFSWLFLEMYKSFYAPLIMGLPFFLIVLISIILKRTYGEKDPEWIILGMIKEGPATTLIVFYTIYIPVIAVLYALYFVKL